DAEFLRVVDRDVDRAVAALREPGDAPPASGCDRPVMRVDVVDDVACDEGRPPVARSDPVDPLLVVEGSRRSEGQDENQWLRSTLLREDVVDNSHLNRLEEGERPPGETVQEIEHGVAT